MTRFPVTIHNFVKNVHYQLQFEEIRALQIHHLTRQMTDEDFKNDLYYLAITEDGSVQSTNLVTVFQKLKSCYSTKPVTVFISSEEISLGKPFKQQYCDDKLIVMINGSIQIDLDCISFPITWVYIKKQIYEKLSNNSIILNFDDLSICNNWKKKKGCIDNDDCIRFLTNELREYGQTTIYVETVSKNNKKTDREIKNIIPQNQHIIGSNLNNIMKGLERLEESIAHITTDDVFIDIPLKNEELFEFYDKIKTEKQLIDLKHSYEKYQQWLTLYGNDEDRIESYLISHNEKYNSLIQSSNNILKNTLTRETAIATSDIYNNNNNININSSKLLSSPYNIPNVVKGFINLKIFVLDLNVCFKFTNEQDISLPSGLSLEFDYRLEQRDENGNKIGNDLIQKTYCIDLIHGFGVNVTRTFTRFKHELGTKFHIQDIENARIVKKDTYTNDNSDNKNSDNNNNNNNKKVLYIGVRDYFKEEHDDKPVRIFTFETNKNKYVTANSSNANDIISTSIGDTDSVLLNIDEYDLLTETDSNF